MKKTLALFMVCIVLLIAGCASDTDKVETKDNESDGTFCAKSCGDGVCQEVGCLGEGCTCAEDAESCPEDCGSSVPEPDENDIEPRAIGGDKDEHGCYISAGYQWCEAKQKCIRSWEEDCNGTGGDCIEGLNECCKGGICATKTVECVIGTMPSFKGCDAECNPIMACEKKGNNSLANPAAEYCVELGGSWATAEDSDGGQIGVCNLPDGRACEEWALFRSNGSECVSPEETEDEIETTNPETNSGDADRPVRRDPDLLMDPTGRPEHAYADDRDEYDFTEEA